MTIPRDNVAGLIDSLLRNANDCENMARWATPELAPLLREAADQLAALSVRVIECEARTLRAEQERDRLTEVIDGVATELDCGPDNEEMLEAIWMKNQFIDQFRLDIELLQQERDKACERAAPPSHVRS